MSRAVHALAGLVAVLRNENLRRLESAQTFVRGCLNVVIVVTAFRVHDANAAWRTNA